MIIKDWIVFFLDENKDVVYIMELYDLSYEETEIIAEDNLSDELNSYEIKSLDEYYEENESNDDNYFKEDEEDE